MITKHFVVTYLKRHDTDHPEREALAKDICEYLKDRYNITSKLVNLKDISEDREFRGTVIGAGGDGLLIGSTYVFTNPHNDFLLVGAKGRNTAFYAQTDYKQYKHDIERIIEEDCQTLPATRITISSKDCKYTSPNILNEVAIKEKNIGQMFRYELEIEGKNIYKRSHGGCSTIIFATPIGSTAWGLAAGGSIIYNKTSKQIAITPESPVNAIKADPYNLANLERDRLSFLAPGIFPLSCQISFKPKVDAVLIKDGRWWSNDDFPAETEFSITEGEPLNLIRLKERGFLRSTISFTPSRNMDEY